MHYTTQTRHDVFIVPKCVAVDGDCQVITPDLSSPFDYEMVSLKWAKVVLTKGSWKNALTSVSGVSTIPLDKYRKIDTLFQVQGP
jgi:hypothetical protein